jgi:hypothetical protein
VGSKVGFFVLYPDFPPNVLPVKVDCLTGIVDDDHGCLFSSVYGPLRLK